MILKKSHNRFRLTFCNSAGFGTLRRHGVGWRIWRLAGHLDDLSKGLTRTVDAYNRTVGTIESRVLVTARRFKELGVSAAEPIPETNTVERTPRPLQAPEMADMFGDPDDEDQR